MNASKQKQQLGQFAIDCVNEMVEKGDMAIDEHGRPNIIRNLAEV